MCNFTLPAASGRKSSASCFMISRGPRLLFAETGTMLPAEFFAVSRGRGEFPDGLADREQEKLEKFVNLLLEKDFLREQPLC